MKKIEKMEIQFTVEELLAIIGAHVGLEPGTWQGYMTAGHASQYDNSLVSLTAHIRKKS